MRLLVPDASVLSDLFDAEPTLFKVISSVVRFGDRRRSLAMNGRVWRQADPRCPRGCSRAVGPRADTGLVQRHSSEQESPDSDLPAPRR